MITILNPEKYVAGLYERLSNENIESVNGIKEAESGSISNQKSILENFCNEQGVVNFTHYTCF